MTTKIYSLQEVAKHNTSKDMWLSIDGKVYDVTKYQHDHPGGAEIMLQHAGTESTESYNDVGHSNSARKTLDKYLIGELDEEGKAKVGTGKSGSGGSSVLPYALAAVALAAALVYQFGLPKK